MAVWLWQGGSGGGHGGGGEVTALGRAHREETGWGGGKAYVFTPARAHHRRRRCAHVPSYRRWRTPRHGRRGGRCCAAAVVGGFTTPPLGLPVCRRSSLPPPPSPPRLFAVFPFVSFPICRGFLLCLAPRGVVAVFLSFVSSGAAPRCLLSLSHRVGWRFFLSTLPPSPNVFSSFFFLLPHVATARVVFFFSPRHAPIATATGTLPVRSGPQTRYFQSRANRPRFLEGARWMLARPDDLVRAAADPPSRPRRHQAGLVAAAASVPVGDRNL